ncbi:MAG: DUF86 domain-containing protein [Chloroflexota bacterium]|nr:MAG: DUF86 domain-containing protein [Chloroflexota bacterium]
MRRLRHIVTSITLIAEYTRGGRERFFQDTMAQDAVLRRLETLADATHQLSPELKSRNPRVQWRAIYGFRNIAAHACLDLHLDTVWEIVDVHLPSLGRVVGVEIARLTGDTEQRPGERTAVAPD